MASVREQALDAFYTLLVAGVVSATDQVFRNKEEPVDVPAAGIVTMRDGSSGEPETVLLSPQRFIYQHIVDLTVIVHDREEATRDSILDSLLVLIDTAIVADRTLGGIVDWVESQAPDVFSEEEGGQLYKYATVPVMIRFSTTNALS